MEGQQNNSTALDPPPLPRVPKALHLNKSAYSAIGRGEIYQIRIGRSSSSVPRIGLPPSLNMQVNKYEINACKSR